jgi:hypothetical protein
MAEDEIPKNELRGSYVYLENERRFLALKRQRVFSAILGHKLGILIYAPLRPFAAAHTRIHLRLKF